MRQVRDLAQEGQIPALRIGGEWRFEPEALEQWLAKQRSGPQESIKT